MFDSVEKFGKRCPMHCFKHFLVELIKKKKKEETKENIIFWTSSPKFPRKARFRKRINHGTNIFSACIMFSYFFPRSSLYFVLLLLLHYLFANCFVFFFVTPASKFEQKVKRPLKVILLQSYICLFLLLLAVNSSTSTLQKKKRKKDKNYATCLTSTKPPGIESQHACMLWNLKKRHMPHFAFQYV